MKGILRCRLKPISKLCILQSVGLWEAPSLPTPEKAFAKRVATRGMWKKWDGNGGIKPEVINRVLPAFVKVAPNGIPPEQRKPEVMKKIKRAYYDIWTEGNKR